MTSIIYKILIILFSMGLFLSSTKGNSRDSLEIIFYYKKFEVEKTKGYQFTFFNPKVFSKQSKDNTTVLQHNVNVENIIYQSTNSFQVSSWLTKPILKDSSIICPVIVFQHWGLGDKDQFLSEAIYYSQKGFICLLPDAPWHCPDSKLVSLYDYGYEIFHQGVMNALVGLDFLAQNHLINTSKIFFVGHSFGAGKGAILSAIDKRYRAFVLMAGTPSLTRNYKKVIWSPL